MDPPPQHLAELSRSDCLALLQQATFGRVGVSIGALPVILPVFLTAIDGAVVFRTVPGTKLSAAVAGAVVAVEVDEYDEATGAGWSVLIRGVANQVMDSERAEVARSRLPTTWIGAVPERLVEVSADVVTGRRLG